MMTPERIDAHAAMTDTASLQTMFAAAVMAAQTMEEIPAELALAIGLMHAEDVEAVRVRRAEFEVLRIAGASIVAEVLAAPKAEGL